MARGGLLDAVHDHAVAGRESLVDDPRAAAPLPRLHVAGQDGVALADDVHELTAERLLHRALWNRERAVAGEAVESDTDELTRARGDDPDSGRVARNSCVPVVASSEGATKSSVPVRGSRVPSGRVTCTESLLPGWMSLLRVRVLLPPQELLGRWTEADVDRIEHVDGGEQVGGAGHPAADLQVRAAHATARFRRARRVVQILLRFGEVALGGLHVGPRVVHVLLRHGVLLHQRLEPVERALGVLIAGQRTPIGRLGTDPVEAVEDLTRLHAGAFGEGPLLDHAVYPRPHLDPPVGIDLTGDIERRWEPYAARPAPPRPRAEGEPGEARPSCMHRRR